MEANEFKGSFFYGLVLPKLEKISLLVAITAIVLAWTHVGRFETILINGLATLAITSFLRAFEPRKSSDEMNSTEQHIERENALPVAGEQSFFLDLLPPKVMSISSAVVLLGILFKSMFWDGGEAMLRVGLPLLAFFVLIWATRGHINWRALIVAIFGGLMLFVSSETLIHQLYSYDPQLVELMVNQIHHPQDRAANEALRTYRHQKYARQ